MQWLLIKSTPILLFCCAASRLLLILHSFRCSPLYFHVFLKLIDPAKWAHAIFLSESDLFHLPWQSPVRLISLWYISFFLMDELIFYWAHTITILVHHLYVNGQLGWFSILVIMNSFTIKMGVQMSVIHVTLILLGIYSDVI